MRTVYFTRDSKGRKLAFRSTRMRFFRMKMVEAEVMVAQGAPVRWFRRFDDTSEAGRLVFAEREADLPETLAEARQDGGAR